ncbi:MAG TPA: Hsp20/alpha crystallin family protein [Gemmata sp.]|nr:Hsp20/alpha crystallin family protein [Gemmata sp.]
MASLAHDGVAPPSTENAPSERGGGISPRVDVLETENEFLVLADMPGTRPEDVDIRFEQGELTVHGRRAACNEEFTTYHRVFSVADTVSADRISAELKAGVLTIRLPKVEAVKPKRIAVSG